MIKGKTKLDLPKPEEVYDVTNGGYDIYKYYLGKVGRQMPRPWGKKERKPSWGIYPGYGGYWYWKDQANEETGTAIQFVERYFHLNYSDAMAKICWDFGIGGQEVKVTKPIVTWEKPILEEYEYADIQFIDQPFKKYHHEFWNSAEVTEAHCNKMNCFAAKSIKINGKRVGIMINEPVFVYVADGFYKLYFPKREKAWKFRNNVPYHHLWNFDNIEPCEKLIIQKSTKDLIVTSLITPDVIGTQCEHYRIFDEDTRARIKTKCDKPILWYGSDPDGVEKSTKICTEFGYENISTPQALLPEINDTFGYACRFKLLGLQEFMKEKNLI